MSVRVLNGRIACLHKPGYALFFFLIYILHHELDSFQTFKDFMGEISDDINDFLNMMMNQHSEDQYIN